MDRTVPFSLDVLADAREQLQQLSQLSPCDSHFVASVLQADLDARLSSLDSGNAVSQANHQGTTAKKLSETSLTLDSAGLDTLHEILCYVKADNSVVLSQCIESLAKFAEFVQSSPLGTSLAQPVLKAIMLARSHPGVAGDQTKSDTVAKLLINVEPCCRVHMGNTLNNPFLDVNPTANVSGNKSKNNNPININNDEVQTQQIQDGVHEIFISEDRESINSAADGISEGKRPSLQPKRSAPPLPTWPTLSAATQEPNQQQPLINGVDPSSANNVGTLPSASDIGGVPSIMGVNSQHSFVAPGSNLQQVVSYTTSALIGGQKPPLSANDRAMRVRSWLKTLRLHKYCSILDSMNYQEMISLSSADLERLGMVAKGARTKMLKCISGLRETNTKAEETMQKLQNHSDAEVLCVLSDLLEPDNSAFLYGPRPDDFDIVSGFMNTVHALYTGIILSHAHRQKHPRPHDVHGFFALLDKALRHEHFPVEEKKVLFSWKNDCHRVILKWRSQMGTMIGGGGMLPGGGGVTIQYGAGGGGSPGSIVKQRPVSMNAAMSSDPWGGMGAPVNAGYQAPNNVRYGNKQNDVNGGDHRQKNRSGFESRTRAQRATSFRDVRQGGDRGDTLQHSSNLAVPGSPLADPSQQRSRHSKSTEQLAHQNWDAFGFGPLTSIWDSSGGGVNGTSTSNLAHISHNMGGSDPKIHTLWSSPTIGIEMMNSVGMQSGGGGGGGVVGTDRGFGHGAPGNAFIPAQAGGGLPTPSHNVWSASSAVGTNAGAHGHLGMDNQFVMGDEAGNLMDSLCSNIAENSLQSKRSTAFF